MISHVEHLKIARLEMAVKALGEQIYSLVSIDGRKQRRRLADRHLRERDPVSLL